MKNFFLYSMQPNYNPFDDIADKLQSIQADINRLFIALNKQTENPYNSTSPLLTINEAARFLGLSPKTMYNNIYKYPHSKINGRLRFSRNDLETLVKESARNLESRFDQFIPVNSPFSRKKAQ